MLDVEYWFPKVVVILLSVTIQVVSVVAAVPLFMVLSARHLLHQTIITISLLIISNCIILINSTNSISLPCIIHINNMKTTFITCIEEEAATVLLITLPVILIPWMRLVRLLSLPLALFSVTFVLIFLFSYSSFISSLPLTLLPFPFTCNA
jgi:hypothetical protein